MTSCVLTLGLEEVTVDDDVPADRTFKQTHNDAWIKKPNKWNWKKVLTFLAFVMVIVATVVLLALLLVHIVNGNKQPLEGIVILFF